MPRKSSIMRELAYMRLKEGLTSFADFRTLQEADYASVEQRMLGYYADTNIGAKMDRDEIDRRMALEFFKRGLFPIREPRAQWLAELRRFFENDPMFYLNPHILEPFFHRCGRERVEGALITTKKMIERGEHVATGKNAKYRKLHDEVVDKAAYTAMLKEEEDKKRRDEEAAVAKLRKNAEARTRRIVGAWKRYIGELVIIRVFYPEDLEGTCAMQELQGKEFICGVKQLPKPFVGHHLHPIILEPYFMAEFEELVAGFKEKINCFYADHVVLVREATPEDIDAEDGRIRQRKFAKNFRRKLDLS